MSTELKSQGDIKTDISKREDKQKKGLEQAEAIKEQKMVEVNTAKKLKLRGTSEGIKTIKDKVDAAAKATDKAFDEKSHEIKKEVFDTGAKFEKDMKTRSEDVQQDHDNFNRASRQIEITAAKSQMEEGVRAVKDDKKFLDEHIAKQEDIRKRGEQELKSKEKEIKGIKPSYSSSNMNAELKSQKDIKTDISKREDKQKKGLEQSEAIKQQKLVEVNTAKKLKLRGTSEGIKTIKEKVDGAAKTTDKAFDEKSHEIKKEVFDTGLKFEEEMKKRSEEVQQDRVDFNRASRLIGITAAKSQLEEGVRAAKDDKKFLDEHIGKQEKIRIKGEDDLSILTREVYSKQIAFRNDSSEMHKNSLWEIQNAINSVSYSKKATGTTIKESVDIKVTDIEDRSSLDFKAKFDGAVRNEKEEKFKRGQDYYNEIRKPTKTENQREDYMKLFEYANRKDD